MKITILILFSLVQLQLVSCYPTGAPASECSSMIPGHGVGFQTSPSPYAINVVSSGSSYTVSIQSTVAFKGFILGAFDSSGNSVGQFTSLDANTKYLQCSGNVDVTQATALSVTSVSFTWSSGSFVGTVTFKATVVQAYSTFWSITKPFTILATTTTLPPTSTTTTTAITTTTTIKATTTSPRASTFTTATTQPLTTTTAKVTTGVTQTTKSATQPQSTLSQRDTTTAHITAMTSTAKAVTTTNKIAMTTVKVTTMHTTSNLMLNHGLPVRASTYTFIGFSVMTMMVVMLL